MAAESAVSDTGPIIHLSEIGEVRAFTIVSHRLIPREVAKELRTGYTSTDLGDLDFLEEKSLTGKGGKAENRVAVFVKRWGLQMGEAEAIALSLELGVPLIFTDDPDARAVAKRHGLSPHGSVGILLRAYREGILTEMEVIDGLRNLHVRSSLHITLDLVKRAIKSVKNENIGARSHYSRTSGT